jgi:GTP pyrophosphokinase
VLDRLGDVYDFAAERHAGQTRPAGQPYVQHLLQVVDVLVNGPHQTDPDLLAAALLHDVVEDTRLPPTKCRSGSARMSANSSTG